MRHQIFRTSLLWLISVLLLFSAGCSKLTAENYDRLKTGMDYEEVIKIFGETDDCSGALGIKSCKWGNDEKYVKVNFAAGKVVMFSSYGL